MNIGLLEGQRFSLGGFPSGICFVPQASREPGFSERPHPASHGKWIHATAPAKSGDEKKA